MSTISGTSLEVLFGLTEQLIACLLSAAERGSGPARDAAVQMERSLREDLVTQVPIRIPEGRARDEVAARLTLLADLLGDGLRRLT